jgi:anti-anti-sigma factor
MESYYRLQSAVDIDSAGKLRSDLLDLVNTGGGDVIVDCVHLEFIDSIGVAVLGQIRRLLAVHDRELRIVNISAHARRPFDLLGHADYFGLGDSEHV